MEPCLNAAYSAAERCAEQQALALSQKLQQSDGISSLAFRSSVGSGGFSIYLDHSTSSNQGSAPINNNIFTFTAGVLPANLSVDPVTQLWKLFQQGAPLCLVFNSIRPNLPIPVASSDDLRACKKAVYEFIIAIKTQLHLDDDFIFTISNVFLDSSHDLLKVMRVVNHLMEMNPLVSEPTLDPSLPDIGDLKLTDDRSKVFRELIQTERKYLSDLELLMKYRDELLNAELIANEQLHVLFPNLNDIVDFHRRLLNGLECNINVPTKYQRIGSVFLHASNGPFKSYEPWTIGQISAIELINRESANLKKSSSLIDPGFELQSYIIKPIQRLCKYPLLLKELIKAYGDSTDSPYYNELSMAHVAMKDVANQVNEAQRRAENVGFLQNLVERVKNWRGFNLRDQGDLLYHSVVAVKDGDSEKEYVAYLFENIIFFFIEVHTADGKPKDKKMRDILTTRKKSGNGMSSSTANLLENLNSVKEKSTLELKGRVYISEIYNISSSNLLGYMLVISWSGKKESGSFTLRYRTEEPRNQWETCLRQLKTNEMNSQIQRKPRDSRGSLGTHESYDNYNGNGSPMSYYPQHDGTPMSSQRHNSSSSTMSMMKGSRIHSGSVGGASANSHDHRVSDPLETAGPPVIVELYCNKVKIAEPLRVSMNVSFFDLHLKISSHIAASGTTGDDVVISKLKYKDEDGDFVVMDSNDDWVLALDMVNELCEQDGVERSLTIWVS